LLQIQVVDFEVLFKQSALAKSAAKLSDLHAKLHSAVSPGSVGEWFNPSVLKTDEGESLP
jgi:hypothetical protein